MVQVSKYEYNSTTHKLYSYLKLKVEHGETEFFVKFKDKDGVLLQYRTASQIGGMPGYNEAQVGDTVKVEAHIPNKNILKQAVSAKLVKRI